MTASNCCQKTDKNTSGACDNYGIDMIAPKPETIHSAYFSDAVLLYNMTVLDFFAGLLLVEDAGAGIVYRLKVYTSAIRAFCR